MQVIPLILIMGGLVLLRCGIRGTKPASATLWGKNESGKPIKLTERVSWGICGAGMIFLGAFQLLNLIRRQK